MPIQVLTRARSRELITLAELKDRLQLQDDSQDEQLELLIDDASAAIETFLGTDLALQQYREDLAGAQREPMIYLGRSPVDPLALRIVVRQRGEVLSGYKVADRERSGLYRSAGWPCSHSPLWDAVGVPLLDSDYWAGYVLPDWISTWTASATKALRDWVRPTSPPSSPFLFECTVAGQTASAGNEPNWSALVAGGTVVDGTVTWTARELEELPEIIRTCAWLSVRHLREQRAAGLLSIEAEGFSETYSAIPEAVHELLPLNVLRALSGFRR